MSKGFTSSYRIALLASLVLAMFAGVEARLVWLHVIDRDDLLRSVNEARRQLIADYARRGDIVDDHGALLATSRSVVVLGVDPQFVRGEDRSKWPALASLIGIPLSEVERICTTKTRSPSAPGQVRAAPADAMVITLGAQAPEAPTAAAPTAQDDAATGDETELDDPDKDDSRPIRWAKLSEQVPESAYRKITELGIRGVYGRRVYRRDYPHNEMAAHIVGFVDSQEHPMAGMEHYADFYLRGENGWLESEKDGKSRELAQFRTREVPAVDGFNVSLSVDATVQHIVEDELAKVALQYEPAKATIIVSDPRTGFILALANYPSFDLNTFNKLAPQDQRRMRNVAVADEYEPGSVFKIVAVAGALNEGLVTPRTEFDCNLEKIDYNGITRGLPRDDDHYRPSAERGGDHRAFLEQGRRPARDEARRPAVLRLRPRVRLRPAHRLPRGRGGDGQPEGAGEMGQHDDHADADGPVRHGDGAPDAAGHGRHRLGRGPPEAPDHPRDLRLERRAPLQVRPHRGAPRDLGADGEDRWRTC